MKGLPFMRITVVGSTGCGKTSLVSAFINRKFPHRYMKTDSALILYRKVDMKDEVYGKLSVFVEVEDTPGSERGASDDAGAAPAADDDRPPQIRKGSRVKVVKKEELKSHFENSKYSYKPLMEGMAGKQFTVKLVSKDGSVGLPSPDGSEAGIWNFPPGAVKLSTALELPIDKFLRVTQESRPVITNPQERKDFNDALQKPMSAYKRKIGDAEMDKTLTRNRMGYMICFDMSDGEGNSLKEAMNLVNMLEKNTTAKKNVKTLKPFYMLVGTKIDRTREFAALRLNEDSALDFSETKEIPFAKLSAKTFENVQKTFEDVLMAISSNETLWAERDVDDDDGGKGDEETEGCTVA